MVIFMRGKETIKILYSREKTIRQKINLIISNIYYFTRKIRLNNYPVRLTIDPSNYCNLHCALCPVGKRAKGRTQCLMNFDIFKKIIDECGPYLCRVNLYNWGEPLINKDIFKMIKYARKMSIDVNISSNLNYFNDNICNNLIQSGLNKLIVSLDGASQKSIEKYQKGNSFELVINNMREIINSKRMLKSDLPFIQWRFIINKYNEHEISKAQEISKQLKIDKLELGYIRCDMGREIFLNDEDQYKSVKAWLPNNEKLARYNHILKAKKVKRKRCKLL